MAKWIECGTVKDKNGKDVEVQWDEESGKIYLKQGSWGEFIKNESAGDERSALAKAYARLHY